MFYSSPPPLQLLQQILMMMPLRKKCNSYSSICYNLYSQTSIYSLSVTLFLKNYYYYV